MDCGPIPDQPLYEMGDAQFHAVVTRPATFYGYYGPEPEEPYPCGPVMSTKSPDAPSTGQQHG